MANFQPALTPPLREFVSRQHMFFTATAPRNDAGRINLSPKGIDTFRIFSDSEVGYLDLTGSGNETAAHVRENGRLTIMFCSFEDKPLILRLYGRGDAVQPHQPEWSELISHFTETPGQRQIIRLRIESVQSSCGYGVPLYACQGQREKLIDWAEKKGNEGLRQYWGRANRVSIDGLPTGMAE